MTQGVDRRAFIAGLAAGAAVMAFDPVRHSWMTAAQAAPHGGLRIPRLDGELVIEPVALEEAADDFGHIIYRTPTAVLRPGSPQDVVKLVRYANRHGLQVAMRGQGHATFGQAQAQGGVVIDSRTLNTIHSIGTSGAVVDAGVQWIALLQASLAMGLTPPVSRIILGSRSVAHCRWVALAAPVIDTGCRSTTCSSSRLSRARGSSSRVHPRNAPACSTPC